MAGKFIFVLLLLLVTSCSALADVDIPKEHWVQNHPDGYCAYAAMETIGRFYGLESLYKFERGGKTYSLMSWYMQWPSVGATSNDVNGCLTNLGISYSMIEDAKIDWLKRMVDKKIPVVVGARWEKEWHAVIVVDVTNEWVKYIDSNDTKKYHWVSRKWFEWAWSGWSIVIYK